MDGNSDYPVGYGKPPFDTRFPKGRSGNPSGRPRRAQTLAALLHKALDRTIIVAGERGHRRMTKREAIITQLVDRSAEADLRATRLLLDIMHKFEGAAENPADRDPAQDARAALLRGLSRLAAATEAMPEPQPAASEPEPATQPRAPGEDFPGDDEG